jgi:hypothetical protein
VFAFDATAFEWYSVRGSENHFRSAHPCNDSAEAPQIRSVFCVSTDQWFWSACPKLFQHGQKSEQVKAGRVIGIIWICNRNSHKAQGRHLKSSRFLLEFWMIVSELDRLRR